MIPATSDPSVLQARGAAVLLPLLLVVALAVVPSGAGADSPGGQRSLGQAAWPPS